MRIFTPLPCELTAVQSEVEGQATLSSKPTPEGTVWLVQVLPPLVVARMLASPAAMQSKVEGQATPVISCGGAG